MSHLSDERPSEMPTSVIRADKAANVPHRWRNLYTLIGVGVVENTEHGLTTGLFPTIARVFGLDNGHLGLMAATGKIISVPFGPGWVWFASRTSRRFALTLSCAIAGLLGIFAAFSGDFITLLIFNTLMAACLIGAQPLVNAIVSDSFDDASRGRAVGIFYGVGALLSSVFGPAVAQLARVPDGWRWGLGIVGAICMVASLAIQFWFKDPGVGAAETELAGLSSSKRDGKVTLSSVLSLFRIPSFLVMLGSRLLSGHLLVAVFAVQFLATERGIDNATAALVLMPYGIGYFVGTFFGGYTVSWLDRVVPMRGRIVFIQAAQLLFAAFSFVGTQFRYDGIWMYGLFFGLMAFCQGLNPGVNRPILMSITLPELRGQAFAIYITVFEAIGWALFALGAGYLANVYGLQTVFLWVLVILMIANAALLGLLHVTYPKDVHRVTAGLERRRLAAS